MPGSYAPSAARLSAAVALALTVTLCLLSLGPPPFYHRLEESLNDLFSYDRGTARPPVVLVGIDRRTFSGTGRSFQQLFPLYADLIRRLSAAEARCIAFDLSISTAPSRKEADRFVAAVKGSRCFVLASRLPETDRSQPALPETSGETFIIDSGAIRTGFVDLVRPGIDGEVLRRIKLAETIEGQRYMAFSLVAAAGAMGRRPGDLLAGLPMEEGAYFRIPFAGRGGGLPMVSCVDVLEGRLPDSVFRDRLVIVGPAEDWFHDFHHTSAGTCLGIQVHGNAAGSMMSGDFLVPLGTGLELALVVTCALLAFFVSGRLGLLPAAAVMIAAAALLFGLASEAASGGTLVPVLGPLLALFLVLPVRPLATVIVQAVEARRVKRLFGQFVSKEVLEAIARERDSLKLEGTSIEASVLFSDIRGFTRISETLGPEATFRLLNDYFARMVDVVFRNGGRLDKFIGDAVMAVYGAPFPSDDDPERAVRSAWMMRQGVAALNAELSKSGGPELKIGVGICTGPVHAGVIGTSEKMEYAVIGDTVNTASRLESMTKTEGVDILMDERTFLAVRDKVEALHLGERKIRGRSGTMSVYALIDVKEDAPGRT